MVAKEFTYRGGPQVWSNRYHTNGPLTITLAEFEILADAVVADELPWLSPDHTVVEVSWYDASTATSTNPHGLAVHTKAFSDAGTLSASGLVRTPGDCAAVLGYGTDARSTKNHPIYLFNFMHGVYFDSGGSPDTLADSQRTALEEYGDDWLAGFSDGTNTHTRCGPRGAVAQNRYVKVEVRHRDFPG